VNPSDASYWTDQQLLEKYRKGHHNEWLGILLERYLHLIFGVCMKYLKNEEDARDTTQQICLQVLGTLPRHQVTYFKSWLYQVAKNHCLMKLRQGRHRRILPLSEGEIAEDITDGERAPDFQEQEVQYRHLNQALATLNEPQRRCLELFYLQKKTYQEVSEEAGYSLSQVKSHIQNGKRNLRLTMERLAKEAAPEENGNEP
jgi:RNA polymerase sigma-70 factor (ECF subfamily)